MRFLKVLHKKRWWSLRTVGYCTGWLGVTYHTLGAVASAVTMTNLTEHDPNSTLFTVLLTHCLLSLAANLLLIVGINQNKPYYLLPQIGISGLEIFAGIVLLIGASAFFSEIDEIYALFYIIPSGVALLGICGVLWLCVFKIFRKLLDTLKQKSAGIRDIFSLKSKSIDICA